MFNGIASSKYDKRKGNWSIFYGFAPEKKREAGNFERALVCHTIRLCAQSLPAICSP